MPSIGPRAAGRVSVDHPFARQDVARLGYHLNWHGGLTLDYLFQGQNPVYIECNPPTVEPGQCRRQRRGFAWIAVGAFARSRSRRNTCRTARHPHASALAMLLGAAVYGGTRRAVLSDALGLLCSQIPHKASREALTPVWQDLLSAIILLVVLGRILFSPKSVERLSAATIKAYAVPPEAIQRLTAELLHP